MTTRQQGLVCGINPRGQIDTIIGLELIGSPEMFRRMIRITCADLERRGLRAAVMSRTTIEM